MCCESVHAISVAVCCKGSALCSWQPQPYCTALLCVVLCSRTSGLCVGRCGVCVCVCAPWPSAAACGNACVVLWLFFGVLALQNWLLDLCLLSGLSRSSRKPEVGSMSCNGRQSTKPHGECKGVTKNQAASALPATILAGMCTRR